MPIVVLNKSNINLWDEYPDLELIEEFRILKQEEGYDKSNNILKAIYYIWDPKSDKRDSGFSEEELIKDITKNLIGDKNFIWAKHDKTKEAWLKYCFTKTDTLLKELEDEIEAFHLMIKKWKWTKADSLDKAAAMKAYNALFTDYAEIKKLHVSEKLEREEMEGGYQISMLEEEQQS